MHIGLSLHKLLDSIIVYHRGPGGPCTSQAGEGGCSWAVIGGSLLWLLYGPVWLIDKFRYMTKQRNAEEGCPCRNLTES